MRIFKTLCIDTETKMQMILSECTYNMACYWLESQGFSNYIKLETNGNETWLWFMSPRKRLFIYDENRGYLLGR